MTDRQAKSALALMIVLGAAAGGVWAWCQYRSLLDVRSWNLMGLGVIFAVAGFAGVFALLSWRRARS
jgi:hypothetical protein